MNRAHIAGLAGALAALVFAGQSQACDIGRLTLTGGGVSGRYDPIAPTDAEYPFTLNGPNDPDCAGVRVRISAYPDITQTPAANGFLRLENGSSLLVSRILDETGRSNTRGTDALFRGTYALDGSGSVDSDLLHLRLARGQGVPPGTYQGRFRLVIEQLDSSGGVVDSAEIPGLATIDVGALVSLSAAWGTDLDLGVIRSGGRSLAPIRFRAYANTPYEIAIESDNDFELVRGAGPDADRIDYVPVLSGATLNDGDVREQDYVQPSGGYRDHTLDVEVPVLPTRPAGEYRDYMTVRIRAQVSG